MKKRYLSALLCAALTLGLCAPARAAEESMTAEVSRVTLAVKQAVAVDDGYTGFSGDVDDMGALRYWRLNWWDESGGTLTVLADDAGRVMEYSVYAQSAARRASGFDPAFSKVTADAAAQTAKAFLARVLSAGESAVLTQRGPGVRVNGGDYYFRADILLDGLPSFLFASLTVDSDTGLVVSFRRSDVYEAFTAERPAAKAAAGAADAAKLLSSGAKLELQYVAGDDGAALQYVASVDESLYVDAQTGKLTDLDEAWKDVAFGALSGGTANTTAAAAADSADKGLSAAESAGIEKLSGVLSQSALDAAVRKVTALGLDRYTLAGSAYSMDPDSGLVRCTLRYARPLPFNELTGIEREDFREGRYQQVRVITVDGRTGALLEGWTSRPWCMKETDAGRTALQAKADAFFALWRPDYAGQSALTEGAGGAFHYARQVNGYFFHDNWVSIDVDGADGSIESFFLFWDDAMTFAGADGILSADAAMAALQKAYAPVLRYLAYPVAVDTTVPIWSTYAEYCGPVAYRYVLGYAYEAEGDAVLGVDAKTGALVRRTQEAAAPAYTDLSGSYAASQIEALSAAGIRLGASEQFRPAAALRQKEMLVLLLNACGWSYDVAELDEEEALQGLYEAAWGEGFLPRSEYAPERTVTRLELVRAILSASPYGPAARLTGIYKVSFRDAAAIPSADLGYAAIAQALGMVQGDARRRFLPNAAATRQSAAAILFNYMSR